MPVLIHVRQFHCEGRGSINVVAMIKCLAAVYDDGYSIRVRTDQIYPAVAIEVASSEAAIRVASGTYHSRVFEVPICLSLKDAQPFTVTVIHEDIRQIVAIDIEDARNMRVRTNADWKSIMSLKSTRTSADQGEEPGFMVRHYDVKVLISIQQSDVELIGVGASFYRLNSRECAVTKCEDLNGRAPANYELVEAVSVEISDVELRLSCTRIQLDQSIIHPANLQGLAHRAYAQDQQ